MPAVAEVPADIPDWLLRPLPANAVTDDTVNESVMKTAGMLYPEEIPTVSPALRTLGRALEGLKYRAWYESAANAVAARVWAVVAPVCDSRDRAAKLALIDFAVDHMSPEAAARVCRRLAKDADPSVRRAVGRVIRRGAIHEVALPATKDGPWSPVGWLKGIAAADLSRHKVGKKVQETHNVPVVGTIKQLRTLLDIRSEKQLGFFLLASDKDGGPYTTFTIPKSDGGERAICAPKVQLKWVQRRIHERILSNIPAHDAAHGFITGRSVVTNAAAHVGAAVIAKFDLKDFFPTIHYYRVLGLFASLGYAVGDARFASADDGKQVAPVLARLCCYTPDPKVWGQSHMPQGAPTSPAISNLVCRRLDSRLTGLAKNQEATYTRYADDITFSFRKADPDLGRFRWWVDQICHQEGFLVNQKKFRVIRRSQRQLVTGVVVNDGVRVPRDARRRFRAILHNCQKTSVAAQSRGNPRFAEYLRGFASYLHMIHPEDGAEALALVAELLGKEEEGQP